jgi:hypothetical protein
VQGRPHIKTFGSKHDKERKLDTVSAIEKLKNTFTRYGAELEYLPEQARFRWCNGDTPSLPMEHGVYCLVSHNGSRIQKIGKAEGKHSLRGRFLGYTAAKTAAKIASDRTDLENSYDGRAKRRTSWRLLLRHGTANNFFTCPF